MQGKIPIEWLYF